ncbi:MAG: transglycosylase SLT domain-containing protein [Pseudomonadota bacterium]
MSLDFPNAFPGAAATVTSALKTASRSTGVSYDFLKYMAQRESSMQPMAEAKTSSAAGLFQFIEQTWLGAVKNHGAKHGLGDYASDITQGAGGRFDVADPARRQEILNLRFDPKASAALAGELANDNKRTLEAKLGRDVSSNAELYAAHFLGAGGAAKLLKADAGASAAALLPKAAAANRPVFYDGARARSVGEVMASIARSMGEPAPEVKSAGGGEGAMAVRDIARGNAPGGLFPVAGGPLFDDQGRGAFAAWLTQRGAAAAGVHAAGGISIDAWRVGLGASEQTTDARDSEMSEVSGGPIRVSSRVVEDALHASGAQLSVAALSALMTLDAREMGEPREGRSGITSASKDA